MCRAGLIHLLSAAIVSVAAFAIASEPAVKHPNLLLNREEIEAVKVKIAKNEWAARLLEKMKVNALEKRRIPDAALCWVLTGEQRFAEIAKHEELFSARVFLARVPEAKANIKIRPEEFAWEEWGRHAWTYDLMYDQFTLEERQDIEASYRAVGRFVIEGEKLWTTTPNLVFRKHFNIGLLGYAIGDHELIDWAVRDPGANGPGRGGFCTVLDAMIKDGHFWGEAPIYAVYYDVYGMLALAEAARHYGGTSLYDFVAPKSEATLKKIIDGYLLMCFPLERTGVNGGSIRLGTFGDGSTTYSPSGELWEMHIINPLIQAGRESEVTLNGELEVAYNHYKDPGYAWLLSLNPKRDVYRDNNTFSFNALTHGAELPAKPTPPPAPSGIYPSQGFAMLRADESPAYWTSGSLAAMMRMGASVGHGHEDYYSIILHGKGRLLYPDINVIQYEPSYLSWTHEGIAHSTLLVDTASPRPGQSTNRSEFTPEAKFFAVSGSAFEDTRQTRALLLTREYMADIFRVTSEPGSERTFDWVLHGIGRLYEGNPAAYRPSERLVPHYWWIDNERSRTTDATWQADWVQHSGGAVPGVQPFGKEWFQQNVGVRMTMLASPATEVFCGDGPITDGPPHHRIDGNPEGSIPLVIARRHGTAATFAAIHEPYEQKPGIRQVSRIAETDFATGIAIAGAEYSDRVLLAFDPAQDCTLAGADGESFAFRDYGYVRADARQVVVRGKVSAFKVRAGKDAAVTVNGKKASSKRDGEFVVFGSPPAGMAKAKPEADAPAERQAFFHYYVMPEEIHLAAGKERECELRYRCVGQGEAKGKLRLVAPRGFSVEPAEIELAAKAEGEEGAATFRVKAAPDAANALRSLRIEPADATPAAAGKVAVSVGVIMTEDKTRPRLAEYVIRAPGYTMRVDQFSGMSYYWLDADGNRRFGRMHNTNFINGMPAIVRDGRWTFRHRQPCNSMWQRPDSLTVVSEGLYGDNDIRFSYVFQEDRIVIRMIPPTRPDKEQTMWLGNFDVKLGTPQKGTLAAEGNRPAADWYFFPHPTYRQGLLLFVPQGTAIENVGTAMNFPIRAGEEIALKFATQDELPGR